LRGNANCGVQAARQGDEVPFQGALVFRGPCGKRLEANHMRTSAQRNAPQLPSGFECNSVHE
jgi:hypothetical protein